MRCLVMVAVYLMLCSVDFRLLRADSSLSVTSLGNP